jgi:hypothetical protein
VAEEQTREITGSEIDFVGFSGDCRVEGKVDLEDARLVDLLNRNPVIVVHDVKLVSTLDGHTQEFEQLEIGRDELNLVVASGPRGDPERRLATKPSRVTMKLGPYSAEGFMHGPPAANPVRDISRRPAMVAITEAVIEYQFCGEPVSESFRVLLINRDMAASLRNVVSPSKLPTGAV